ncbi:MAG: Mss4p nuclear export [Alectoria fallacina]|uniref:Protein BCP1 n=1 Tax=Alectoria fallacina TaxID=1903189 RepID=A0A8H3FLX1_9LECA|nr:MAG: Mss4p nuclear export [Alectoria fallacina]
MAKRKEIDKNREEEPESQESSSEESSSDDDTNMLDVEFEWFDPQPEHDFHGLKTLLRQLFDVDAQSFDLSALTDLILAQPLLGSTVKVDGNKTDPYAFLTVINLHEHQDKEVIEKMIVYIRAQAKRNSALSKLDDLVEKSANARIGLVLTERLVNIPSEVVPPMYKMLLEEISWAIEEKEPYNFTHYLILSKTYQEVASALNEEDSPKSKKQKKAGKKGTSEVFYFHPEDEVLQRHASCFGSYEYLVEGAKSDSKRTFQELGIKPEGHMILIEANKFEAAVKGLQEYFSQG